MRSLFLAACLLGSHPFALQADEYVTLALENGSQLTGELLNPKETPRRAYSMRTLSGIEVTIGHDQVREVTRRKPAELEYDRIKRTFEATVAGQWEAAEWCRDHQLLEQRKVHLQRLLDLEPDHAEARRLLGYSKVDGQWKTQAETMTERGYVEYKGRWRLKQEVEILEIERKSELAEKNWHVALKRWREWLEDPAKQAEATKNFQQIRDPFALPALRKFLETETNEQVKLLLVEAVASCGAPGTTATLAEVALREPSLEVRLAALEYLGSQPRANVVSLFIARLRDKDNAMVNRAAIGLQKMRDPTAIAPLIDALVTTHKYKIGGGGSPDQYSASFGSGPNGAGSGGFTAGAAPVRIVEQTVQNAAVLDALVSLTPGTNFSYDVKAWKAWLSTQRKAATLDARRGGL